MARGLTIYRLELVGGGVVFAESEPKPSGMNFVFRSAPQGILVALRRSDVARVEQIDAENKPPLDLGGATLKQVAAPKPAALQAQDNRRGWDPLEEAGIFGAHDGPPRDGALSRFGRRYPQKGDDMPGNRVPFPVSRDDLMYGNYRAFPAANGGQSGPPPMIEEGRGTPKAGSLAEPPKVIHFASPPASPNMQVPAAPLVYSEKPHIDDTPSPKPTPPPRRPDLS
jgi:hypothetical protein